MTDKEVLLKTYAQTSVRLAQLLKEGHFELGEQISIENHVLIVQLAITRLKYERPKKVEQAKP